MSVKNVIVYCKDEKIFDYIFQVSVTSKSILSSSNYRVYRVNCLSELDALVTKISIDLIYYDLEEDEIEFQNLSDYLKAKKVMTDQKPICVIQNNPSSNRLTDPSFYWINKPLLMNDIISSLKIA